MPSRRGGSNRLKIRGFQSRPGALARAGGGASTKSRHACLISRPRHEVCHKSDYSVSNCPKNSAILDFSYRYVESIPNFLRSAGLLIRFVRVTFGPNCVSANSGATSRSVK